MALKKLEGLITVPTGGWAVEVTVGVTTRSSTVPAGTYYLSSAGSGSRSLLAELEYQLDTDWAASPDWTVAMSASTGKATITGDPFSLTWTSTALRDVLGFTGTLTGAVEYTGTEQAEYLFLPNCGRGPSYLSPDGDSGAEESDLTVAVSPSGKVRAYGYERRYVDALDFPMLKSSKTWISDEVTANESLQKFWQTCLCNGTRFRYHPDATVDATYVTWVAEAREFKPRPVVPGWDNASALYSWGCTVRKYV